jgi:hypothetical protein
MHLAAMYTSPVIKQALIIARNNGLWEGMLFLPVMISIDGAGSAVRTTRLTIKRTEGCFTSDVTFDTYYGCLVQLRFCRVLQLVHLRLAKHDFT